MIFREYTKEQTSINLICLSYSFFLVSKFVEIEMTDGNSVPFDALDFFDVIAGNGADEIDREDLLIAAKRPPREVACCDASKSSCCRCNERTRREEST